MTEGPRTPLGLKYQLENQRLPFNQEELLQLETNKTGVYALWLPSGGPDECLYVGMSDTCIRRRLLQHLNNETNPELRNLLRLHRIQWNSPLASPETTTKPYPWKTASLKTGNR